MLAARGYDYAHALNRSSHAETYQNMTVGDIAKKVAQRAGFQVGEIEDGGGVLRLLPAEQRDRLGLPAGGSRGAIDFEVVVEKTHAALPQGGEQERRPSRCAGARA